MIGLELTKHFERNRSLATLKTSYSDLKPKISRKVLILRQSLNPKIFLMTLFIATLQSDISEAEYSLIEQAYVRIGTQLV